MLIAVPNVGSAIPLAPQDHHDDGDHHDDRGHHDDRDNRGSHRQEDYHFRSQDAQRLRQNYRDADRINRNQRPHYVRGQHLPNGWRTRIRPAPVTVVRGLLPLPPGYQVGYLDGYAVAYNPTDPNHC